jgi:hypothetical protein
VERWQGIHDPGLMGPDPLEERRRGVIPPLVLRVMALTCSQTRPPAR